MPTHLVLMKLTEHGVRDILNAPARIEEAIRAFEGVGGEVTSFYAVMGQLSPMTVCELTDSTRR